MRVLLGSLPVPTRAHSSMKLVVAVTLSSTLGAASVLDHLALEHFIDMLAIVFVRSYKITRAHGITWVASPIESYP